MRQGSSVDAADPRAGMARARSDIETQERVDVALADLCDDTFVIVHSRERALGEIRHVLFEDQPTAARRERRDIRVGRIH